MLPATPEEVFAAWTDPESLKEWLCPGDLTITAVDLDVRVGGTFRIVMYGENKEIEHFGEYREIQPPERLVFTWRSAATFGEQTLVTINLFRQGEDTELVLVHELFPDHESAANHSQGWQSAVEKLATHLNQERAFSQGRRSQ
jgi:uncharacterized protein YndB with AHSA1/START domain